MKRWQIVTITVSILALVVMCGLYSFVNGTRTEGIQQENRLNAQYLDNQNYLSSYISGFYEKTGLAQAQSKVFDQVLTDAVKGRYDASGGFSSNGAFFSAVVEAYPDQATLMASWNDIQVYITSGREGYRNQQTKLLDMLRGYDTWRLSGIVKSAVIRALGFPSCGLKARLGDQAYCGQAGLDQMYRIVLTGQALNAYQNGTMDPLTIPTTNP